MQIPNLPLDSTLIYCSSSSFFLCPSPIALQRMTTTLRILKGESCSFVPITAPFQIVLSVRTASSPLCSLKYFPFLLPPFQVVPVERSVFSVCLCAPFPPVASLGQEQLLVPCFKPIAKTRDQHTREA